MSAPVSLLDLREFLLDFVGRPAFHQPHQIVDRQFRWDGHECVDMICRQHALDDLDAVLRANLSTNIADPQGQQAAQYLEPVFRRPDQVVSMVVNAMLAGRNSELLR